MWEELNQSLSQLDSQILILESDFNVILSQSDKKGGIIPPQKTLEDFNEFVSNNALTNVKLGNGNYTWTNKGRDFLQIIVCLDRFLISPSWINLKVSLSS